MKLYLQFGHGMGPAADELLSAGAAAGVLLSPRDSNPEALVKRSKRLLRAGCDVLLDPQCFFREATHKKFIEHEYWKTYKSLPTSGFKSGKSTGRFIQSLGDLWSSMDLRRLITPGYLAGELTNEWFDYHEAMIEEVGAQFGICSRLATVALSSECVKDEASIEGLIDRAAKWDVDGYYVVAEQSEYLVSDILWLSGLLNLCAGLKLAKKEVIVGYSGHQKLCLAVTKTNAIAAGTFLNVRAFADKHMFSNDDASPSRRKTWFYSPLAMSEYQLTFLDAAQKLDALDLMKPPQQLDSSYSQPLFAGGVPTSVNWKESAAFKHYLQVLSKQADAVERPTYDEAMKAQLDLLDNAEALNADLRSKRVLAGDRDFRELFNISRAALAILDATRGARLSRNWGSI